MTPPRKPSRLAAAATTLLLAVALASCGSTAAPLTLPPASPDVLVTPVPKGVDAVVDRVVDGDTIVASKRRIRLIGVDTPETVKPNSPVECFGPEASAATKALLPQGTPVRLVRDVEPADRYDRELFYVYRLRDGLFVAGYLVQAGFARPLSIKPNTAHRAELAAWSKQAEIARRGLWGACA